MIEDKSDTQVRAVEGGKIPSYVKEKIRASEPKNRGLGRPRAHRAERIIKRAEKKLAAVLKFASEDVAAAMDVLRKQLKATKEIWDVKAQAMTKIPDEKIRQDAALAILAYEWGRPTEKKIVAHGDFDDLQKLRERIESLPSFQNTVGGKEVAPALPDAETGVARKG